MPQNFTSDRPVCPGVQLSTTAAAAPARRHVHGTSRPVDALMLPLEKGFTVKRVKESHVLLYLFVRMGVYVWGGAKGSYWIFLFQIFVIFFIRDCKLSFQLSKKNKKQHQLLTLSLQPPVPA